MTGFRKTATSAAALSLCLSGTAALADVTAQDVWADWQSYMQGFGYEMTGTETVSGETLSVTDLSIAMELPEGAGAVNMSISEFTFTENGDGTVTMTVPASMPISISVDSPDGEDVDMMIDYNTTAFEMVASGEPDDLTYEYTAELMSMELGEMVVEGEAVDLGMAKVEMADLSGTSVVKSGNLRNIAQTMTTGPVTFVMDFADPEGSGQVKINGTYDGLTFEGAGDYPANMDTNDMNAMLEAGFGFDGTFGHTGSNVSFDLDEAGEMTQVKSNSESGAVRVAMDEGKLMYDVASNTANIMVMGGEVPFPVELAMAKIGFKLLMPVSQSEAEQDFELGITLGDFTMSDMIWGIFDPGAQLPRDPATIAMDLSGKVKLFFDLLDPAQMEAVERGETMPGELNSVMLNDLTINAAGAALTGTGAFTFDNSDLETFDGLPAPDGAVDLKLVGANGLIDRLIDMGLLPQEQAMGARMMMGLFAVPGEGEDTLTSKIEVKPNGQVLANGQRLQ